MGARGYKNSYEEISTEMDYVSWEWHRPDIDDYIDHLKHSKDKPVFSEDRFRIRHSSKYPLKDYTESLTLSGLWDSFIAGGVANIWGKKGPNDKYSTPYNLKQGIRKYREIVDTYYILSSTSFQPVKNLHCISSRSSAICRIQDSTLSVDDLFKKGIRVIDVIDIESGEQHKADPGEILTDNKIFIGNIE